MLPVSGNPMIPGWYIVRVGKGEWLVREYRVNGSYYGLNGEKTHSDTWVPEYSCHLPWKALNEYVNNGCNN